MLTLGAAATTLYLLRGRDRRGGGRYTGQLPAATTLDNVAHAAHLFAFPIWTFAVVAGAIWAEASWGRYWGWDLKETWTFITWVLYAAHLRAAATPGWGRRSAPWLALAALSRLPRQLHRPKHLDHRVALVRRDLTARGSGESGGCLHSSEPRRRTRAWLAAPHRRQAPAVMTLAMDFRRRSAGAQTRSSRTV